MAYLQSMTGGWLLVIPALLLFLLFHLHSSTSCFCVLLFSGPPEPLPLHFPCFRVLRVLHCPTHPETNEMLHCMKPKADFASKKNLKNGTKKADLSCRSHSLSRPAVQFGRCGQKFSLPWSPSAPSGKTPPLILLLPPLTDININELCVFVWHFFF